MDLKSLKAEQRNALLDLLVLGMYADGNLARVEDAQIERVLHAMGWSAKFEREREFDAAVTRVRKYAESPEAIASHAKGIAAVFSGKADRQQALAALEEVLRSDHNLAAAEVKFLEVARSAFA